MMKLTLRALLALSFLTGAAAAAVVQARIRKGSVISCLEICPWNALLAPPGPHCSEGVAGTEMRAGRRK